MRVPRIIAEMANVRWLKGQSSVATSPHPQTTKPIILRIIADIAAEPRGLPRGLLAVP
jgi:hypothetical protein